MQIIAIGVNHKKAPVEIREKLALDNTRILSISEKLIASGKISACVIISTCNRTEIYATSKDVNSAMSEIYRFLADESDNDVEELRKYLYNLECEKAINHLFRVVSGLDSMIFGEKEILGQVSRAYQLACENSASNSVLNVLFQKALKVGKQVQSQTQIAKGASSVGSAAVKLARKIFGNIQNLSILLVGAGEMGKLVARNITNNGISQVTVCNRSHDKAQKLALEFSGCSEPYEKLSECMLRADLVLTCTSSTEYIITKDQLNYIMQLRKDKPLFIIDLAVPRDVEPESSQLPNLHLYNIDDLQGIVNENLQERQSEAIKAEEIIERAFHDFSKWLNSLHIVPVIEALCEKGEEIKDTELEKAMRKMGNITEEQRKIMQFLADSIVSKLMNTPITQLKRYAQTDEGQKYTQFTRNLFDLPVRIDENV